MGDFLGVKEGARGEREDLILSLSDGAVGEEAGGCPEGGGAGLVAVSQVIEMLELKHRE